MTASLLLRRWPLYLLAGAATIALQLAFVEFARVPYALIVAEMLIQPLLIVVVTVYAGCDARDVLPSSAARLSRIIERAWAILLLDAALSVVEIAGLGGLQSGDPSYAVMGTLVVFFGAMLVYAEPFVCLEDRFHPLTSVPYGVLRSMMLAWVDMRRIFWFFCLSLADAAAAFYVEDAARALGRYAVAGEVAFATLTNLVFAALFAVAYLDTLAKERPSSP